MATTLLFTEPLCLVGDCHGEAPWVRHVTRQAANNGASALIALGDFGFWPRSRRGGGYLDEVDEIARQHDVTVFFLRGNHEDNFVLADLHVKQPDGPIHVRDRVVWLPDGELLSWCGLTIGIVGGAPSIDADGRVGGVDWFPNETFWQTGLDRLTEAGPLDVVLAHDCPHQADLGPLLPWAPGDRHRQLMTLVAQRAAPRLWANGHYHRRVSTQIPIASDHGFRDLRVEVLSMNGSMTRGWILLQPGVLRPGTTIHPPVGQTTDNTLRGTNAATP